MRRHYDDPNGGIVVKALVAVWVGVLVFGFVAQTTEMFGSLNGVLVWLLAGGLGVLLLLGFGVAWLVSWALEGRGRRQR